MSATMAPTTTKSSGFEVGSLLAPDGITDNRYIRARDSFWEYCKLVNPKFYRDDRPHLVDLRQLDLIRQEAARHPVEDPVAVAEAEPTQPPDVDAAPKTVEPQ